MCGNCRIHRIYGDTVASIKTFYSLLYSKYYQGKEKFMSVFNRLKQLASVSTVALCVSVAAMSQATAAERYIVSGVENWDTLNIRSEPNARSAIIGEIPSDGKGVNSTGQEVQNGRTTWAKVNWNGVNGWVSKRYLATDYTYVAPAPTPVQKPSYIKNPDYSSQGSERNGSIYDAGSGTVRSVYAGPGNGLPAIKIKQKPVQQYVTKSDNAANTHSHPANRCTRSVSHTHPNGANQHTHRYSCQGQATQNLPQAQVRVVSNANTHTHPRNQFTNAVTHTHASGSAQHNHNYGGQKQVQQQTQVQTQANPNTHTHPRNQLTNAVTHTHASGSAQHTHNYGGQKPAPVQQQAQVATQSNMVTHIHPASQYNEQTQHTHPGGAGVHLHDFLMPPRQATTPAAQVSANTHTHPKNNLTNSVTHTHPNGVNQHSHSYGQ